MYGPYLVGETKQGKPVRLRPPRVEDAPMLIEWLAHLETTLTLSRIFPMSLESEKEWLIKNGEDPRSVVWVIEFGDPLEAVGLTGIHQINPTHRHATTGTFIGESRFWRQGIATIAMQLRTEFAFEHLNLLKLNSSFLEGNTGSMKAQQAAGYNIIGRRRRQYRINGKWLDEVLTEVLAEDWYAARVEST